MRFLRRDRTNDSQPRPHWSSALDDEGRLRVQCWYCQQQIAYEGLDPCAVVLVANWADTGNQREQQFFAHAECFKRSGSGSDLHVLDPDFDLG